MDIVRGAIVNVFLLLGFVSVCSLIGGWLARRGFKLKTWVVGLLFGALAVVSMFSPVFILFWMMVDCRAGVLGTAALLGGLPVALISLVFPCIYRMCVGGTGMLPGLCELVFAALLGTLCHEWFYRQKKQLTRREILLASAFVGFGVDLLLTISFTEHTVHIFNAVGMGRYLLLFFMIPVSMALLSSFVLRMRSYDRLLESANDSEQRMLRSQKMAAIGQLSHRIAHSILNALTVIMGNAELAKNEARKGHGEDVVRRMDDIIEAVDKLSKLAGELVTFSAPGTLRFQRIDLSKCLVGVEQLVSKLIGSEVEVCVQGNEDVGVVKVDPNLIEQVIIHLVINAAEAMERKGRLTIKVFSCDLTRSERARLQAGLPTSDWHLGRFAVLSVQDTGCGMTKETVGRIFEPFFTTKRKTENSGLGLSSVYNIVQKHGGVIDVRSEVNCGTTFLIYFPIVG
jgi:signal transduction histidine kinase